jgi:hypothetical protein
MTSRISVRRTGFRALKRLVTAAYYSSPETFAAVGYPGPPIGATRREPPAPAQAPAAARAPAPQAPAPALGPEGEAPLPRPRRFRPAPLQPLTPDLPLDPGEAKGGGLGP